MGIKLLFFSFKNMTFTFWKKVMSHPDSHLTSSKLAQISLLHSKLYTLGIFLGGGGGLCSHLYINGCTSLLAPRPKNISLILMSQLRTLSLKREMSCLKSLS